MAQSAITFAVYKGTSFQHRTTLNSDIVKLGRDPKSHISINDESAGRMHAVIEAKGDDITLIDLGNDTGTMVNGARIDKCSLKVGDRIQVGDTELVFEGRATNTTAPAATFGNKSDASASPLFAAATANPFTAALPQFDTLNPFASAAKAENALFDVPDDAAPGTYTYSLIQSGPAVSASEVELDHVDAVEVMVMWGDSVLNVQHLTPPRNFYVGEEESKNLPLDFFIPSEKLGTTRMPLIVGDKTSTAVVIPAGASGFVELPGRGRLSLEAARAEAAPCSELSGAVQLALPRGARARIEHNGFAFQVGTVAAGKPAKRGLSAAADKAAVASFGLSMLAASTFVAAMAFFVPPLGLGDDEGVDKDNMYLIQQYMASAAEREKLQQEEDTALENDGERNGGTGSRADKAEGKMGKPTSTATNKKWAAKKDPQNPDVHLAKEAALREAQKFGMIGLLSSMPGGDPNAPTAFFGRETTAGLDDISANGNMWGDTLGEAGGVGGLGLSGLEQGGGGRYEGVGMGNIGTYGHGAGLGDGDGFGNSHGRLMSGHRPKSPKIGMQGVTSVSGRLPAEVIQRIVRQNYGRFRMCYEQGLGRNPNLQGRVAVRFVIGRDGAVSNVSNGGSDLPDSGVVSCVLSAYYGLSFPQPEGGIVTVVYPVMFQPG